MSLYALSGFEAFQVRTMFTTGARLDLYETIAGFLRDGISIHDVLVKLAREYARLQKGDVRAMVLREWAAGMDKGALSFSDSIRPWVPAAEVMLFKAGEDGGDLAGALDNAIFASGTIKDMRNTVLASLAYPGVLLLVFMIMVYAIAAFMIPKMETVIPVEKWPASSQSLATFSGQVREGWYIMLAGLVLMITGIQLSLTRVVGPVRRAMDKVPPWGLYRSVQSSVFLISIAAQMKAGVPLVDALKNMRELSSKYVGYYIRDMLIKINAAGDIGQCLDNGFLDKETGIKVRLLAETSGLERGMDSIGRKAIHESGLMIKALSKIAQMTVMVLLAGFVAWTFLSINAVNQSLAGG